MRFWDSSALVPLLVLDAASGAVLEELERDADVVAWWTARVECASAIARLERDEALPAAAAREAFARLDAAASAWREIQPVERIRDRAMRILRLHPLRAADALQLAAAIVASEEAPSTLPFVTLDDRLADAAEREGFRVIQPGA